MTKFLLFLLVVFTLPQMSYGQETGTAKKETDFIWPNLAPGETLKSVGTPLPVNPREKPPITRLVDIRTPTIDIYPPSAASCGAAVLILPGGGFGKVVPDLEGSEAATFLGKLGITTFVLNYRTSEATPAAEPKWKRPLQDGQRAMRWIRHHADRWDIRKDKIGLLAFSAGGQVGAILISASESSYADEDRVDEQLFRPDFAMLVYPWRCYDKSTDALLPEIRVSQKTPPSFIVHTHDDASTSLGAVYIYAELKRNDVPAELHVYENGGHGYGTRARPNSNIGTWKDRATDWLRRKI